jgi:hypothetical protein
MSGHEYIRYIFLGTNFFYAFTKKELTNIFLPYSALTVQNSHMRLMSHGWTFLYYINWFHVSIRNALSPDPPT